MVSSQAATGSFALPLLDDEFRSIVNWAIGQANKSIELCVCLFNVSLHQDVHLHVRKLARMLADAAWRGVEVRVLLGEPSGRLQLRSNLVAASYLRQRGINTRMLACPTHHLKFIVVDMRIAVIGSHNWTPQALATNFEASLLLRDSELAEAASKRFHELWRQAATTEYSRDKLVGDAGEL